MAAQAIGLILNEFLTNSFKYAFGEGRGNFSLHLGHEGGRAELVMADDGPGMPEEARPGLGLSLIDILTKQIEGEARWDSPGSGTRLMLEFPIRVS